MAKYRRKTQPDLIVEAEKLTMENVEKLANWAQAQIVKEGRVGEELAEGLNIHTPHGKERLHQGMYLVEIGGLFYTASAPNFEQGYEPLEPLPQPVVKPATTGDPWHDVPRINP